MGGSFAIWFYVVIDPDARHALWIRHTRRRDAREGGEAINWAAAWTHAPEPLALKSLHADSALTTRTTSDVALGECTFEPSRAKGRVASGGRTISWDFSYEPATSPLPRAPAFVEALPLPVHSEHMHASTKVVGSFEVDGARHTFGPRSRMVQARIWGTAQAQEIFWIWTPAKDSDEHEKSGLELVSARLRAHALMPRLASMVLHADGVDVDGTSVLRTARTRVSLVRPGMLEVRSLTRDRAFVTRAFAEPRDFVGYVYRGPDGSEVYVAQADNARCEVSIYARRPMGVRVLERVLTSSACALEIHRTEPLPGIDYLPWLEPGPVKKVAHAKGRASPPHESKREPLPKITDVLAIGLSYADHVRETGSRAPPEPIVFRKELHSLVTVTGDAPLRVAPPSSDEMITALSAIEPDIADPIRRRFPLLPALMDYEVEIGLVLLDPFPVMKLRDRSGLPRFAWFLANDLTARSCQILGERVENPYPYWAVAKSFPKFLPVSPWSIAPTTSLDELPSFELTTHVNGELRQKGTTRDLLYSPRDMLLAASKFLGGDLPAGLAIITGTPAGVGLSVPRWKKAIADVALDRFGKLSAAARADAHGGRLLRTGDLVTCAVTGVGEISVLLDPMAHIA